MAHQELKIAVLFVSGTRRDDTTQRLYGMQDANWNVTSIADDAGNVQERFAYSAYGVPGFLNASFTIQSSSASAWETLYCGYRFETSVNCFHVRNRVYHTALGIWIQRDPASSGHNLYEYCDDRPLGYTDPTGMFINYAGAALGGCLLGAAWSLVSSWWWEESPCMTRCNAGMACLVGAITGVVTQIPVVVAATANDPLLAPCLISAVSTFVSGLMSSLCNCICDECPCRQNIGCTLLLGLLPNLIGCAVAARLSALETSSVNSELRDQLTNWVAGQTGNIMGVTSGGICSAVS